MNANQRETNAFNEDIVDLGIDEDVVDPELAKVNVRDWDGIRSWVVASGINGVQALQELVGVRESYVNEALTIGNGDAWDRKTTIFIDYDTSMKI